MKDFRTALERLIEGFEGFTDELRIMADEAPPQGAKGLYPAGAGEEPDGYDNVVNLAEAQGRQDDIDDDTIIKMRSGDLRKVLDAYRKLTRYAREGRIPTQDERVALHQHIRKVKHLVRKPIRHAA